MCTINIYKNTAITTPETTRTRNALNNSPVTDMTRKEVTTAPLLESLGMTRKGANKIMSMEENGNTMTTGI